MTARWERRAPPLAWAIALSSFGLLVASLVVLALDSSAIDSLGTAGWLLLGIAAIGSIYLLADSGHQLAGDDSRASRRAGRHLKDTRTLAETRPVVVLPPRRPGGRTIDTRTARRYRAPR